MPTESELRDELHGDDGPTGSIDLDRVIRRARARRTPRVAAIAAGSVLAVAVIAVPVTVSAVGMRTVFSAADSGGSAVDGGVAPEKNFDTGGSGGAAASAATLTRCGDPLPATAPAKNGLIISVTPLTTPAGTSDVPVTVRLTNSGSARVQGVTASEPIVTISENGVVVWHSNGAMDSSARVIDLEPGMATTYDTHIRAVRCTAGDEGGTGFPSDLPALSGGTYTLSAAIDVSGEAGSPSWVLVTGPTSTLRVH